tara:strand:+ start:2649 stop:2954 length:306 start_codon:yes stop_codon:yes gene_type:complete
MANKSNGLSPSTKLSPIDKEYIKALIDEAMEKLSQDVKNDLDSTKVELDPNKASSGKCKCSKKMDDIQSELDKLKIRYEKDDKYTMTKARIIDFIERNRIE